MSRLTVFFGIAVTVAMVFTAGCESDSTPDDYTFRNNSTRQVALTLRNTTTNQDQRFTLAPNGGEVVYMKALLDPLTYSYSPTATVSDRRDGSLIVFENRN